MVHGSALGGRGEELRGRSVIVATRDQLTAALALIELDGVARRLVLLPPDVAREHLPAVISDAAIDTVLCDDESEHSSSLAVPLQATPRPHTTPPPPPPPARLPT